MRRQIKQMVVLAALISGIPSLAMAQSPGVGNPWQGRPGLPPGTGGFDPFGPQRPNIPGVPAGVGGFDPIGPQWPNIPGLPPGVGKGIQGPGAGNPWQGQSGKPPGVGRFDPFGQQQLYIPGLPPGVGPDIHGPGAGKPWQGNSTGLPPLNLPGSNIPGLPPGTGGLDPARVPQIRPVNFKLQEFKNPIVNPAAELVQKPASEPFRSPFGGAVKVVLGIGAAVFVVALLLGYLFAGSTRPRP